MPVRDDGHGTPLDADAPMKPVNGHGQPLRVVHIISGLGQGGAETVLYRLVTAPRQNTEHIVVSMGDEGVFGPRLRQAGVAVHTLNMTGALGVAAGPVRLWRLLRDMRPDVVQTWMYHADLVGGLVARLAGSRAVSWGIRNSGADLAKSSRVSRGLAAVCAPLSRAIPAVVVACAENAAIRHCKWGYDRQKMRVVHNGYDLSRWQPDVVLRARLRHQWGVADDEHVVGVVARWNPLKDHENLFAAMAKLPAGVRVRLVLVGHEMTASNPELMSRLRHFGLDDRTILMGRRDDVETIMPGFDVHVLSSRAEGFPNVVAEAMAAGVLCVVTDVGDAAHIVGDAGWVVPPRDPVALAQGIERAVQSIGTPEGQRRLNAGRRRVAELFSLDTMVTNWQTVWRQLAADYPAHARRVAVLDPSGVTRANGNSPPEHLAANADCDRGRVPRRRLLMVVNNPAFFLSHRLPVAMEAREAGYEVHIATMDGPSVASIVEHGLTHHVIPLSRSGRNPVQELRSVWALWRLFRRVRPDVVHAVTIKPVLYGGIAARLARVPAYVAAVSGLGYVFMRRQSGIDYLRLAATVLYRLALGHANSRVIFQNASDRATLERAGVVRPGQCVLIRGSGVDLDTFYPVPEPSGPVVALCVARLLEDKGIHEFVRAARLSGQRGEAVRWVLAGSPDPGNPVSVPEETVRAWHDEGVIEWLGERRDIAPLYQQAHIAVLPSYREGLPKSLVEAAACGRAVVTSDVPGCRDAIEPGVTGVLVPARDADALAEAVIMLAQDASRRQAMGRAARQLAEREFDVNVIVAQQLAVYDALLPARRAGPDPAAGV